jgi:hypothetical protein
VSIVTSKIREKPTSSIGFKSREIIINVIESNFCGMGKTKV